MVVPFFIFSASTGDPLAGLSPTFTTYKKRDADGNLTNLAQPPILDRGNGLYEFTTAPGDAARGTVIVYVIDCGLTALSRYDDGTINGDEAVEADELVSSTLQLFGVDAAAVRRHHFANSPDFSEDSNPTYVTVAEMIDDCAGELQGRLLELEIDPNSSAITVGSAPYVTLRNLLRKMVAVRIMADMTNQDSALQTRWEKELDGFWKRLEDKGSSALGNESLSSSASEPEGPTTHLDELAIDVGDPATDASAAIPPFRLDDAL